jgi:hypothetical protein
MCTSVKESLLRVSWRKTRSPRKPETIKESSRIGTQKRRRDSTIDKSAETEPQTEPDALQSD